MDTVTQMLLGGAIGQAGFRHRFGRRAIAVGAVLGLLPDLDVGVGLFGGQLANWIYHRGPTHSLLVTPLAGILIGWLLWRWHRRRYDDDDPRVGDGALGAWMWLGVLGLVTHPIIDLFTSYGTQLLAPLSDMRFSINAMSIIDPVYSLILLVAVLYGLFTRRTRLAQSVAGAALLAITAYTVMAWGVGTSVERRVASTLDNPSLRVTAYTTLLQPFYRRVVVDRQDSVDIAFVSALRPDQPITWKRYERNRDPRIAALANSHEGRVFHWFNDGQTYWQVQDLEGGRALLRGYDYRYGANPPDDGDPIAQGAVGMWGIALEIGPDGLADGPVSFIRTAMPNPSRAWADLRQALALP